MNAEVKDFDYYKEPFGSLEEIISTANSKNEMQALEYPAALRVLTKNKSSAAALTEKLNALGFPNFRVYSRGDVEVARAEIGNDVPREKILDEVAAGYKDDVAQRLIGLVENAETMGKSQKAEAMIKGKL